MKGDCLPFSEMGSKDNSQNDPTSLFVLWKALEGLWLAQVCCLLLSTSILLTYKGSRTISIATMCQLIGALYISQ